MTVLLVTLLSSLMIANTSPIYQDTGDLSPAMGDIRSHEDVIMERIVPYPGKFMRNLQWKVEVRPRFKDSGRPYSRLRRGGKCMFNALAFNCDYKDAIGAANEASYWGSSSPGK